jgi:hypothetical protein
MYSGLITFSESELIRKQSAASMQEETIKPYLRIQRSKDCVTVRYELEGQEAMLLYCRRDREDVYTLLARLTGDPYLDERPNLTEYSEVREYKAIFCNGEETIGEPDCLQVKTKGKFRFF